MRHPPDVAPAPTAVPPVHALRAARRSARRTGWQNADVLRVALIVFGVYVVARLVWFANPLFFTAFLGLLCGLAVSSGADMLSRWRVPRGIGAPLIVIVVLGSLGGLAASMAPTLHRQGVELRHRLPDAIDRVEQWTNARRDGLLGIVINGISAETKGDSAAVPAGTTAPSAHADTTTGGIGLRDGLRAQASHLSRYLFPFISSTVEVVTGFIIIVFLSIYIAVDPRMYRRGVLHLVPRGRRARIGEVLSAIATILRRWLVTQLIAMAVMGVVTTVVLLALHVKAAVALGLLSGLFEFIPTFGAIASSLPAIAMAFLDSPDKALWVALAYVGVHFLEGHLLIPLLMKGRVNLPPALTVLSQALMAIVFGFLGLMCAVPILAAVMVAVRKLYVEDVVGDEHAALAATAQ